MMDQLRFRKLLAHDPIFKEWFTQKPALSTFVPPNSRPWRLFLQGEAQAPWIRTDYISYAKAFEALRENLPNVWDLALHCKPQGHAAPIVVAGKKRYYYPLPMGHEWCMFCRRPTIFRRYKKHRNLKYPVNPEEKRCNICGARAENMKVYKTPLDWPLDAERFKLA
jgi:hypothetical protein